MENINMLPKVKTLQKGKLSHVAPFSFSPTPWWQFTSRISVHSSCVSFHKNKQLYVFHIYLSYTEVEYTWPFSLAAFNYYFLEITRSHFLGTIYK